MKTILAKYGYMILHYLWSRRDNIYSIWKEQVKKGNIRIDGKIHLEEVLSFTNALATSGLIIDEEDEEKVVLGGLGDFTENTHKKLIQYNQSSWACVIYATCRVFTYNTGIVLTRDEVEGVKIYARNKGWWKDKIGMTFRAGMEALKGWLKINKGITLVYDRVYYNSEDYKDRKTKGYACTLGGQMTSKYVLDFNKDGVINERYTWKEKKKYGHCFMEKEKYTYVDNFPSKLSHNIYVNNKWADFIKHGYMYSTAYFCTVEGDVNIKSDIIKKSIEKSDYEKYLDRGFIEHPNPDRIVTERLYGTLRERELQKLNK